MVSPYAPCQKLGRGRETSNLHAGGSLVASSSCQFRRLRVAGATANREPDDDEELDGRELDWSLPQCDHSEPPTMGADVALPSRVRDVRLVSWSCMGVALALELGVLFGSPHSEPRRWLQEPLEGGWQRLLLFAGSLVAALSQTVTCASGPGYLEPSRKASEQSELEAASASSPDAVVVDTQEEFSLELMPLRWCKHCCHLQPRRAKHCKECDLCVRTFDHHCFWIGGCVGEFNHPRFYMMLVTWVLVLSWHCQLLYTCGSGHPGLDPLTAARRNWYLVFMFPILILYLVAAGFLMLYHTYLIATAQTTWEHLARDRIDYLLKFPRSVFPFSRGLVANVHEFFSRSCGCSNIHDMRSGGHVPRIWRFQWLLGQPIPFNVFENEYWSCC